MKRYTIKDFLKLNSPCYGCGKPINVFVGVHAEGLSQVNLKLVVDKAGYSVRLSKTYHDSLTLLIEPRTNRFSTNDGDKLVKYLKCHSLFLTTRCPACVTAMTSHYLEFSLVGGYIKPVGISSQYLVLNDKNNRYIVNSDFFSEKTIVMIFAMRDGSPISTDNMDLPLLPSYRFKDKEHFMAKLKTYLLFS